MKIRQDAWSHEDDLLLAETVLRHIRDGSTQVAAFDEVGDLLNRTSAACGFRWNAEVRSHYAEAVELAKKQRREKKRAVQLKTKQELKTKPQQLPNKVSKQEVNSSFKRNKAKIENHSSITLDDCIAFLMNFHHNPSHKITEENNRLEMENQMLNKENTVLLSKYDQLIKKRKKYEHDYKFLMKVLDEVKDMSNEPYEQKQNIH